MSSSTSSRAAPAWRVDTTGAANRILLACGVVAGPIYLVTSVVQGAVRPGFDFSRHDWSLLTNGTGGWIQMGNLIVSGLLTLAAAVGIRRALRSGPAATWGPRLIGGYGGGLVGAGFFRADPALGFPPGTPANATSVSWHGWLHLTFGGIGFLCLIGACFALARRFAAQGRTGWAAYSRATGVVFLSGFACIVAAAHTPWATPVFAASVAVAWAWISLLCVDVRGTAS